MDVINFAIEYVVGQGGLITDEDDKEIQKLAAELRKHLVPIEQVTALAAENTRLREALKPFARIADLLATFAPVLDPEAVLWRKDSYKITLADCIAARDALGQGRE